MNIKKIYKVQENKIIINDLSDFNIEHILECGQVFRYQKISNLHYVVFSKDKKAEIITYKDYAEIITKDVEYFINYFDLDTDYAKVKQELNKFSYMKEIVEKAYGIRILRQDILEMIISFIISQNNNIKRIQQIVEKLCEKCANKNTDGFFNFPTIQEISELSLEDLHNIGLGYRDIFIYEFAKSNCDVENLKQLDSNKLEESLLKIKGVGPKVCDCIMLFAFNRQDCFPVDTWVKKIYKEYFNNNIEENNVKLIRKNLVNTFKNLSGYAQQYLFYYKRILDNKML